MTAAAAQPVAGGERIGRFELLHELGRGAQASVWLARDPRLQREVAVKLLDPEAEALDEWLHEARAVSCLTHPNVVPVFEADTAQTAQGQRPYLVFEYVEGPTLAQARRQRAGPWPAREAVKLLLGVLDALAAAHAVGIVHRDLKPSNVLLGRDGRARVMDFGIAARTQHDGADGRQAGMDAADGRRTGMDAADGRRTDIHAADGRIVGTPGYMSPEAARGEAPTPAMDVFAAGVMLAELLHGGPLMRAGSAAEALRIVQTQDLRLPVSPPVDDALRAIVQRALSRDAAARYDGARSLHAALAAWLEPGAAPTLADGGPGRGTLEFLLRRMRHKTDFPALSSSIVRIQRLASSETETLASLAAEIRQDVALTNKLLRMVNSVHFAQAAGGGVGTVSRAVALVGFAGIRNMAMAVVLLEHMADKGHAAQMAEEFTRALMAGTLASELSAHAREAEEAFLGSMFQNLGRMLAEYYFPEEALQIRQRLPDGADAAARDGAARQVLGLSFDELGAGVARAWGLPDTLSKAMRRPDGDVPLRAAPAGVDRLRWLGRSANALTDAYRSAREPAARQQALLAAAEAHAGVLDTPVREIIRAAEAARTQYQQLAQALGLPSAEAPTLSDCTLVQPRSQARGSAADGVGPSPPTRAAFERGLSALAAARVGATPLSTGERIQLVLQALHAGLAAHAVVMCLRDPKTQLLAGRFGLGAGGTALRDAFRVKPAGDSGADLFAALCARCADTLISDTRAPAVAARLPGWYRGPLASPSFVLLPMSYRGASIGLIYADRREGAPIVLSEQELALARGLRDEAVAALSRQG
jgi:serine/threonine protein kinase